jgi:thiol:disulfide interchange protein DsbC
MKKIAFSLLCLLSLNSFASTLSTETVETISQHLKKLKLTVTNISFSEDMGLIEVMTDRDLIYFTADGNYMIRGKVYNFKGSEIVSETEKTLSSIRVREIEALESSMITFPALNEKFQVTVFTDISCQYCRMFHSNIKNYNDLGITVRYLAFPRSGTEGSTFKEMMGIWCSDNPRKLLTDAKNGYKLSETELKSCSMPIKEHYETGFRFIVGTPTIILSDGTLMYYQSPEELIRTLTSSK